MDTSNDELPMLYDLDSVLIREVFARFGRAFYVSNCLEREIAGALMHVEWRSSLCPPMTREEFEKSYDDFYEMLEGMTMGKLITRLKKQPDLPSDLSDALDECLQARNKLAHHYFWERVGEFAIAQGQQQMLEEFDSFLRLFEETDKRVHEYTKPYFERHGLTNETLAIERTRVIEEARRKFAQ